jgi:hypothetical protein
MSGRSIETCWRWHHRHPRCRPPRLNIWDAPRASRTSSFPKRITIAGNKPARCRHATGLAGRGHRGEALRLRCCCDMLCMLGSRPLMLGSSDAEVTIMRR